MQRIGRYELAGEIGRGASGIVYRATDPAIGRIVAVKTIRFDTLADTGERNRLRERMFREARSAGALLHPNIVTIFDAGEDQDLAYIAMELVEGNSLDSRWTGERPIPNATFLAILGQLAAALDFAHAKGIIHRDIKPANILVDAAGQPKITDFGIAKLVSQQMTHSGTLVGTPSYMSPEQIEGALIDGRSDQFSLAVIAYEVLTGERPFRGDTLPSLLFQITQQTAQAANLINPSLPVAAAVSLQRALSKHPISRFRTCTAFVTDLAKALESAPSWRPLPRGSAGDLPTIAAVRPASVAAAAARVAPSIPPAIPSPISQPITPALKPSITASITPAIPTPEPAPQPIFVPSATATIELPEARPPVRLQDKPRRSIFWVSLFAVPALVIAAVLAYWAYDNLVHGGQQPDSVSASDDGSRPSPMPAAAAPPPVPVEETASTDATTSTPTVAANASPVPGSVMNGPRDRPDDAPPNFDSSEPSLVEIATRPNGAKVSIDNGARTCTSPCSVLLDRGSHTLALSLDTYRPVTRRIEVPRDVMLEISIERATGTLMLRSTPAGALVSIDGQPMAQKTPAVIVLPIGKHKLRLTADGKSPYEETIEVKDQVISTVNIDW